MTAAEEREIARRAGWQPQGGALMEPEDEIDLARLWGIVAVGKWKIAAAVAAALACAAFYLFVAEPGYRVDALVQIEPQTSGALQGLMDMERQLTGQGSSSEGQAQMEILRSRSVVGETVDKLHLDVVLEPRHFPLIGEAIARRSEPGDAAGSPADADGAGWLGGYAWRPVLGTVTRVEVPQALLGKPFTLRALGGKRYVLYGPEGEEVLRGNVGEAARGQTPEGPVELFVSKLAVSDPPTDFTLVKRPRLSVVEGLQQRLRVSEKGQDSGILQVSLEGTDRDAITEIVNTMVDTFLRKNVEAQSEEASKSLEFLNQQLPELRSELYGAETRLTDYRQKEHATDLDAEAQALLDQVVELENKRSQLELKLAELRQRYTGDHPALQAGRDQIQSLREDRAQLERRINQLPEAQKDMLRLRRDVEVNTELYTALLSRAQELRVMKAGTTGNVRIVDHAVEPVEAVSPRAGLALALALVLGGVVGGGYVLMEAALRRGIVDPKEIERLGIPVYAIVPFSGWLGRRARRWAQDARQGSAWPIVARERPDEPVVEALRSMRTNLYFAQRGGADDVVLVGGPSPGVGKSMVALNLGYLLAEVGKKVVVVDADLRRGSLHHYHDHAREPGLSQVLAGQLGWREALRELAPNLALIATGPLPPNPAELLMRESLAETLQALRAEFDMVIVDAPPALAVTDAAVIAASAPGIVTFLVARAGYHSAGEIEDAVRRMRVGEARVAGVVFNALREEHVRYSGSYSYSYGYKPGAR